MANARKIMPERLWGFAESRHLYIANLRNKSSCSDSIIVLNVRKPSCLCNWLYQSCQKLAIGLTDTALVQSGPTRNSEWYIQMRLPANVTSSHKSSLTLFWPL